MANYYKITNVSARSEKGERGIFIIEAGKLLKPGETIVNVRRLNPQTMQRTKDRGLDIVCQSTPFKDLNAPTPPPQEEPKKPNYKEVVPDFVKAEKEAEAKAAEAAKAAEDAAVAPVALVAPNDQALVEETPASNEKKGNGKKGRKGRNKSSSDS